MERRNKEGKMTTVVIVRAMIIPTVTIQVNETCDEFILDLNSDEPLLLNDDDTILVIDD